MRKARTSTEAAVAREITKPDEAKLKELAGPIARNWATTLDSSGKAGTATYEAFSKAIGLGMRMPMTWRGCEIAKRDQPARFLAFPHTGDEAYLLHRLRVSDQLVTLLQQDVSNRHQAS